MSVNCTIITIGDELLIGQVIDTNSAYIAQRLNEIGISTRRRIAIGDSESEIRNAIQEGWTLSDIIIMTGGLGPTKDDMTKKTIAEYFQVGFHRDEETYHHVRSLFESRNLPFLKVNEAQADIPTNAKALFNQVGTAPGMWIAHEGKLLISLPGVPHEMNHLMKTHVLPRLEKYYQLPPLYHYHIQTQGIGESFLAKKIESIESQLPPNISLAYLPSPAAVHLRLSGVLSNKDNIETIGDKITQEVTEYVYGHTTQSIEDLLVKKLSVLGKTLTTAESATGGHIADRITNITGSSKVYLGGWNCYSNSFKEKELDISPSTLERYTDVSEETVKELFDHALKQSNADYAIAVVGYLEKSNLVERPHAYLCFGNNEKNILKKIDLIYPRIKSKEAIATTAMVGLYRDILN